MLIILAKCCGIFMVTYWVVLSALLYYTRDPFISTKNSTNETMKGLEKEPSETNKKK